VNVLKVGSYIRDQRVKSRLSLRNMSRLAGVSIPYLSQVERGLRKPSAEILQAIAKGLRISAETLYVQAGFLEDRPVPDVASAIMADPSITERHRQALLQIYQAFRDEAGRVSASVTDGSPAKATKRSTAKATKGSTAKATKGSTAKAIPTRGSPKASAAAARSNGAPRAAARRGGRAETEAARSPHPAPLRPSATTT
jgi:transcriptional regulator with XRE-family HTH domain